MRKRICILLFAAALATVLAQDDRKPYPYRWVRIASNLRDDSEVERIRQLVTTASEHGLNGIAFSAGLDQLDQKTPDYFQRLKRVREICAERKVDIIPSFFSAGYGGSVLSHDKNLAAGLPVRDAVFVASDGKARFVAEPLVKLANGSFENYQQSAIESFAIEGKPGEVTVDTAEAKEGKASIRFENVGESRREFVRLSQEVSVQPYRCYRIRCWVKAKNMGKSDPFGSGNFLMDVLGGAEKRPLQYQNPRFAPDGAWQEVSLGFNSWGYDRVEIAPKVRGLAGGQLRLDGLQVEEVGLVNLLRRPGTPLVVRSDSKGTVYEEGRDYAPVADSGLNFRYDHDGPEIQLLPSSRIQNGERLRVSYYHGTAIYNGQTPVCMSEPKLYEIWSEQARLVHEALTPGKYLLNMDEVRTGGSCEACKKRGLTLGEIAADCVTRQFDLLRKVNPKAEIFVWSDMLDPNHNANPDRKYYYLAEGNYAGSWSHVPKELVIVCWNYRVRTESLKHFSTLGFRTMAGAYYDADNLENPEGWLQALHNTPGASGLMYTTWLNKYDLLGPFGDLVSK
jgi:hypothetical protein